MIKIFNSPLDQFEINLIYLHKLNYINFSWLYKKELESLNNFDNIITISTFTLYSFFCFFILFFFFSISNMNKNIYPKNFWHFIVEKIYFIFNDIVYQNFESKFWGRKFFPFLTTIFFFILFFNLLGLMPFGFTNTSFAVACLNMSVSIFLSLTIIGIFVQGFYNFFEHFIPKGIPVALLPMLVIIEIISYVSKAFSLSIRLFANMMSGHILLNILSNFSIKLSKISIILGIVPFIIVLSINCLELGICILQAYVFMILLTLYLNDSFKFDKEFYNNENIEDTLWYPSVFTSDIVYYGVNYITITNTIAHDVKFGFEKKLFFRKLSYIDAEYLDTYNENINYYDDLDCRLLFQDHSMKVTNIISYPSMFLRTEMDHDVFLYHNYDIGIHGLIYEYAHWFCEEIKNHEEFFEDWDYPQNFAQRYVVFLDDYLYYWELIAEDLEEEGEDFDINNLNFDIYDFFRWVEKYKHTFAKELPPLSEL